MSSLARWSNLHSKDCTDDGVIPTVPNEIKHKFAGLTYDSETTDGPDRDGMNAEGENINFSAHHNGFTERPAAGNTFLGRDRSRANTFEKYSQLGRRSELRKDAQFLEGSRGTRSTDSTVCAGRVARQEIQMLAKSSLG